MIQLLNTEGDFERILQTSFARPVFVFKHSNYCGASSRALSDFQQYAAAEPAADYCKVLVVENRALSRRIATAIGVPHESPQVILLSQGRVVWHGSHHQITRRVLEQQFQKVRLPDSGSSA